MNLTEAKTHFVNAWLPPNSGSGANDFVKRFCFDNPHLDVDQTAQLSAILADRVETWLPQLFAAQVLMRTKIFDRSLMEPLLHAAIEIQDPSSNADFLWPCLTAFGAENVIDWLVDAFARADQIHRIGISSLVYHLKSYPLDVLELINRKRSGLPWAEWVESHDIDASKLRNTIAMAAQKTDNLIELYHYAQALDNTPEIFPNIPINAVELSERIAGMPEYETLLYDRLGWQR